MNATIKNDDVLGCIEITAYNASGKRLAGWMLPLNKQALAKRLARAIEAGVVCKEDANGVDVRVLGRTLNADLVRLGF